MTPVTLWVDAIEPHPGGIGRYTLELSRGLVARGDVSARFYARNRAIDDPERLLRGDPLGARRGRFRRWWDNRRMADGIVHGPNYFLPKFARRGVITVHDLSVLHYPETHPAERIAAFKRDFQSSLSRATHIITDTETVRREVIETFGVDPAMVTAIHLGVDASFRPRAAEDIAPALAELGLRPGQYGLCVSTLEPRKKIAELLAAWRNLPRPVRDAFPLVLSGGSGWRNESLREEVARGEQEGWLRHLGFVEEKLLPQLYAGARLFIYPSIYEGFGLPPLEAMACGVPVMVSERSCMPEVCGDAAHYFDPDDGEGFVTGLEACLTDTQWQSDAIGRGLDRSAAFTWQACVDRTVEIYQRCYREAQS